MWQRRSSLDMDTFPSVVAHGVRLSSALVVEGSGPGPDASKQLAARDGDLSAIQKPGHGRVTNCGCTHRTLVFKGSGPGPDASKQSVARDGDLSAF